jgi:hypothetical protein
MSALRKVQRDNHMILCLCMCACVQVVLGLGRQGNSYCTYVFTLTTLHCGATLIQHATEYLNPDCHARLPAVSPVLHTNWVPQIVRLNIPQQTVITGHGVWLLWFWWVPFNSYKIRAQREGRVNPLRSVIGPPNYVMGFQCITSFFFTGSTAPWALASDSSVSWPFYTR